MAETLSPRRPVRRRPTTSGTRMEMGCPSAAASASMPPTPQPSTPMPLAVGVWESVPTTVSKHASSPSPRHNASVETTSQKRSMLSWWQMPRPGGTMRTLSNERLAHLRNEKRSRLRSASMARLSSSALARPATSAVTEWSMTSVQGIRGLTTRGSPPRSTMASRIARSRRRQGRREVLEQDARGA